MAARFPALRVPMQNALSYMVAGQPEVDSVAAAIDGSGCADSGFEELVEGGVTPTHSAIQEVLR
jgi:hypothetical protein